MARWFGRDDGIRQVATGNWFRYQLMPCTLITRIAGAGAAIARPGAASGSGRAFDAVPGQGSHGRTMYMLSVSIIETPARHSLLPCLPALPAIDRCSSLMRRNQQVSCLQQPYYTPDALKRWQRVVGPPRSACRAAIGRFDDGSSAVSDRGLVEAVAAKLGAFYQFTRPHTILGTAVSVISVSVLALQGQAWSDSATVALYQALASALLMNISIVGINQCYDIEIDKLNKPYLPLASGEFSIQTGIAICAATATMSLLIGAASGSAPLLATLSGSLLLGVLYSVDLPLMRWKRFPYLAAACILAVRAVMVQLGFYQHMQQALGTMALQPTRPLLFTVAFMLLFSVVIALFKDIPDVKGDTQAGVRTFSVRMGVERVFWICTGTLAAAYAGGVAFGLSSPDPVSRAVVCVGHLGLGGLLLAQARRVELGRKQQLVDFYMLIWKLFYAEYLLLPFLK